MSAFLHGTSVKDLGIHLEPDVDRIQHSDLGQAYAKRRTATVELKKEAKGR